MKDLKSIIEKAKEVHGDAYDYSMINEFHTMKQNEPIICKTHGVFYKDFQHHIYRKQGCPFCAGRGRYTTDNFVNTVSKLPHCQNYSFEKVNYINNKTKVIITCKEHGDFEITPGHLLSGEGCPKCRYIKSAQSKRRSIEEVVALAKEVHGDKYNYSLITDYKNDRIKYPIICPEHGIFYQTMNNHIKGEQGCPKCAIKEKALKKIKGPEWFFNKVKSIHGDKYDYSKADYVKTSDKICIICPEHGEFWQKAANHLEGQQCPICSRIENGIKSRLTTEEFVEKAKEVHGDRYDYSKTNYLTNKDKILITCKKHGDFLQDPGNHLSGNGCPKCVPINSSIEDEVKEFLTTLIDSKEIILRDRIILKGKELDLYIPSKKIAIECDGLYWHSEKNIDSNFHLRKTEECFKHNIKLIHIFEDEWRGKQDIVKSMLKNLFNKTETKLYARKCEIKEVPSNEASKFLDENHLQGKCGSSVKIGLYYNNELVSLMTFGKSRHFIGNGKNEWELLRFCNKLNTNVVGGASKLLSHFIKNYNPNNMVSYADRRWSCGNLYEKLGFTKYNTSRPNYYYVIGQKRHYRFNYRKSILIKKYNCPENMSEHKFCLSQKWYRIYDCGCLCYKWEKK